MVIVNFLYYLKGQQQSVCSPTVRIIAFQAIDPGSTPGKRIYFSILLTIIFPSNQTLMIILLKTKNVVPIQRFFFMQMHSTNA
jgi:hypothetical protein